MGVEILVHQSVITFSLEVLFINMTPDYVVTDRFFIACIMFFILDMYEYLHGY